MKMQRSMLAVCIAATAFTGSALAKGTEENPAQVEITNFPATQDVAITGTPSVNVSSLPSVNVSSLPSVNVDDSTPIDVNVSNAPTTYSFAGYTGSDRQINAENLYFYGQAYCGEVFGQGARISTAAEIRRLLESVDLNDEDQLLSILPPVLGEAPYLLYSTYPYSYAWFTEDESIGDIGVIGYWANFVLAMSTPLPSHAGGYAMVACSTPDA